MAAASSPLDDGGGDRDDDGDDDGEPSTVLTIRRFFFCSKGGRQNKNVTASPPPSANGMDEFENNALNGPDGRAAYNPPLPSPHTPTLIQMEIERDQEGKLGRRASFDDSEQGKHTQ